MLTWEEADKALTAANERRDVAQQVLDDRQREVDEARRAYYEACQNRVRCGS